jgi:DNA-binding CsgD family transcriptional regulator
MRRTSGWGAALRAARRLAPHVEWRRRLAIEARRASGARFAVVTTCVPGQWHHNQFDSDPPDFDHLREEMVLSHAAAERCGAVVAPLEELPLPTDFIAEYRAALLLRGIRGYVVGILSEPGGAVLGAVGLGSGSASARFVARVRAPLSQLVAAASRTTTAAIALARGFATPARPGASPLEVFTRRERQVAELLCVGLSDLNIARRLGISEHTVGSHLTRVFRKLGVHSRAEMVARLGPVLGPAAHHTFV